MQKLLWKIGGEAGFGIMTTGPAFAKIVAGLGYNVFGYAEYPSLIRGGHNTYEVAISDEQISSSKWEIDLLVCLNKPTYDFHKHRLTSKSIVIYDSEDFEITDDVVKIAVPFKKFRKEFTIQQVMVNTIASGASLAVWGIDIELLYAIIEKEFKRKGDEVVNFNKSLAKAGYEHVKNTYANEIKSVLPAKSEKQKLTMTGNEAFSLATVAADCRFFAAYPMTPTSQVLSILAGWQEKTGMIVRHAEDEISVINTSLGASFGGVRAGMSTSGGGFALMVEGISFAGVAEIPIVIFLGQRPGPATGMPTWTEQGDLLFAVHAGHGEFPKIVLAPGDIYELMELTLKAFDLADIYQTPVIVMGDKLLCESHKSHPKDEIVSLMANYHPNRGKLINETKEEKYLRYKITEDGISERLMPGQKGHYYQANSYEHTEDTHTTEAAEPRIEQVDKRNRKWQTYLKNDFQTPRVFGNLDQSDTVIVSWGGNKGAILDAQRMFAHENKHIAYIHFTHVYPLDREKITPLFQENKRYILLENNSHAQFGQLLLQQTGIEIKEKLLRYDGRPFWPEDIIKYINKISN